MDQYMKMMATNFVQTAVQSTVNKIMESKQSCEVWAALMKPQKIKETKLRGVFVSVMFAYTVIPDSCSFLCCFPLCAVL